MRIEQRLAGLGLQLPDEIKLPAGVKTSFAWVRVRGNRAFISGHGALARDGSPAGPFGKVPSEVLLEQAQRSARLAGLAMLASLKRSLGTSTASPRGSWSTAWSTPILVIRRQPT